MIVIIQPTKMQVRHENCLLTHEELVEVEASESVLEQVEVLLWPGSDLKVLVLSEKFPVLQLPQFPGIKTWRNLIIACEEESSSLRIDDCLG